MTLIAAATSPRIMVPASATTRASEAREAASLALSAVERIMLDISSSAVPVSSTEEAC